MQTASDQDISTRPWHQCAPHSTSRLAPQPSAAARACVTLQACFVTLRCDTQP